jgi:hypothetical protein
LKGLLHVFCERIALRIDRNQLLLKAAGVDTHPPLDPAQAESAGLQRSHQMLAGLLRPRVFPASEDVRGSVSRLGPGVHRDVRLSEQRQRCHALRIE